MKYYFKVIDNKIDSSYIFNENEIADLFPGQDVTINTPSGFIEYKPHTPVIPLKPYEKINIVGYEFVDDLYYLFTHPGSSEEYLAGRLRENIIFHAKRNKDQYVVQKMANDMQISVDSAYQVFAYQTQKKIYETRQVFY